MKVLVYVQGMNLSSKNIFLLFYSFLFIFLAGTVQTAFAQKKKKSRTEYENQRKNELKKIEAAQKILKETQQEKEVTVSQVKALAEAIAGRERLISIIQKEIRITEKELKESESIVISLGNDLKKLKEEYGNMIFTSSKSMNQKQRLMFLFASGSFNQLRMRMKYLKQYTESRKSQMIEINKIQTLLGEEIEELSDRKTEKMRLLVQEIQEQKKLSQSRNLKDQFVKKLKTMEGKLKKEIRFREAQVRKLDALIDVIIKEEMRRKKEKEARIGRTPEADIISNAFAANKGKMLWPVANGFISKEFGIQEHPVFRDVKIENNGVDIQTYKGEVARSVHKGRVVTIALVPGMEQTVIVEHGDFYTVYANLRNVVVKPGTELNFKDEIGTVFTDKNGKTELQFQIWKEKNKLNPQLWLMKK